MRYIEEKNRNETIDKDAKEKIMDNEEEFDVDIQ